MSSSRGRALRVVSNASFEISDAIPQAAEKRQHVNTLFFAQLLPVPSVEHGIQRRLGPPFSGEIHELADLVVVGSHYSERQLNRKVTLGMVQDAVDSRDQLGPS
jgi:hypothetical protein